MRSPDPCETAPDGVHVAVLGLNHVSAPVAVREEMAFADDQAQEALARLEAIAEVTECVLLSTCNRTEVYLVSPNPDKAVAAVRDLLDEIKRTTVMRRPEWTFTHRDAGAMEHLFRVVCGLDSLFVGEAQIFSQVKHAYDLATQAQRVGIVLNRLFQAALHVGKRVRTETEIGAGAVSVSSAAVGLAEKVFGNLNSRTALLVGAGETARLTAEHLAERGIRRLIITNRTLERAHALAERFGAEVIPFGERTNALPDADLLISATSAQEVLFQAADVRQAMRRRPRRPLLVIDLAVPRDIDPAVNELEDVFLHDVDALNVMVEQNLVRRCKEIPRVEEIIGEELEEFFAWYESLAVTSLIMALREHMEAIRQEQIERYQNQFCREDRSRLDQFTRTLVNRILHHPVTRLRTFSRDARWGPVRLDTVRDLFDLEG